MRSLLYDQFESFRFAPEDAGVTSAPPAAETQTATPPPAAPTSSGAAAAETPSVPAGVAAAAPAVPSSPSWLDNLKTHGLPVGKDEGETVENLKRIYQERQQLDPLRQLAPHVQQFLQHQQQFQKYLAEQQKAAAEQQKATTQGNVWDAYWKPPEFNQSWERFITVDPATGKKTWLPDTPHDVKLKYQQYESFKEDQAAKLIQNPHAFLQPTIEGIAEQIAERKIAERMQAMKDEMAGQQFVSQHQNWIYEIDPATGHPKQEMRFDPASGQMVPDQKLSVWGQKLMGYANEVAQGQQRRGYRDAEEIRRVSFAMIQRDFAVDQYKSGQAQAAPVAPAVPSAPVKSAQELANEAFIAKNNPPGKRAGGGAVPAAKAITNERTLREEMLAAFRANGINDSNINS